MKFQVSYTNSLICFILFIVYCFWTGFVYFPAQKAPKVEKSDWRFDAGEICWNQAKFWSFHFLTQKFSKTTNVENSKNFFRTTNLLENMQKNFGGPILNKNTSQKNSRGGERAFPPPLRVNVRFKRDWHKMKRRFG